LGAELKERTRVAEQQVRDVAEKAGAGLANLTFADVTKARLEWLRARGELIKAVSNWERALVKLRQDQGVLGDECAPGPQGCPPDACFAPPSGIPASKPVSHGFPPALGGGEAYPPFGATPYEGLAPRTSSPECPGVAAAAGVGGCP